jgi:hypothetical protein
MNTSQIHRSLEKIAFPSGAGSLFQSTADYAVPKPTVSDVLNALGQAQTFGIGTPAQRTDAFGRIIDTGATVSSPANMALKVVGGGLLGNFLTGMVTSNPFAKGVGTGIGINMGLGRGLNGAKLW